jgi:glucose-6-phosphate isomerase
MKIPELSAYSLGQIIALYERTVAIYAEFININAFHQPGVQAYKLAANDVLELRSRLWSKWNAIAPVSGTAQELAAAAGEDKAVLETAAWLDKAALNGGVERELGADGKWHYTIK